jgi:hypothetical protein
MDYTPSEQFDKVMIGNTHHYIFRECGSSWDWIAKLAVITKPHAEVVIEGPKGLDCIDMMNCLPIDKRYLFNETSFFNAMNKFFKLISIKPTVAYTPNRYIMTFVKKDLLIDNKYQLKDFPKERLIRPSNGFNAEIYESGGVIVKKYDELISGPEKYFKDKDTEDYFYNRIRLAALSPLSNGLLAMLYDNNKLVGWVESKFNKEPYKYFENEKELFKKHLEHQIFLSRNGYLDIDSATINFVNLNGIDYLFDKNGVHPISVLNESHYGVDGCMRIHFNNSYKMIASELSSHVFNMIASKDALLMQIVFSNAIKKIDYPIL